MLAIDLSYLFWIYALNFTFPSTMTNSFAGALEGTTKKLAWWFKLGKKHTDIVKEAEIQANANVEANVNGNANVNLNVDGQYIQNQEIYTPNLDIQIGQGNQMNYPEPPRNNDNIYKHEESLD